MNRPPVLPTLSETDREQFWPALPFVEWQATAKTLHMWTQIVGKIRLTLTPWINHSWHVTLYLTPRGLTTSAIPQGFHTFEIRFDFISHEVRILKSDGADRAFPLRAQSVASFYKAMMEALNALELPVTLDLLPNEIPDPIPFDRDETHRSYDPAQANRFWRVLLQSDRVLQKFRSRFCGKCSPVHFFWGSFDLAVTRFSGRPAPQHPGGIPHLSDAVTREAYSQEVSSIGFWPGNAASLTPLYYSYAYPEPAEASYYACCMNSSSPMMPSAARRSRMKRSSPSRRALTTRLRGSGNGIAPRLKKRLSSRRLRCHEEGELPPR